MTEPFSFLGTVRRCNRQKVARHDGSQPPTLTFVARGGLTVRAQKLLPVGAIKNVLGAERCRAELTEVLSSEVGNVNCETPSVAPQATFHLEPSVVFRFLA